MNKILVAYASKGGATKEASQIISVLLKSKYSFDVEVVDLRKNKKKLLNLDEYNNIVVGSGVRSGKIYDEVLDFLKQDFNTKKMAFFVCSGDAGDPEKYRDACTKYVTDVLGNYHGLKPISTEAFGGRQKMLGRTIFNNFNPEKINAWALILGSKFIE
ncbi:MAG: hypothetical protein IAX21_07065 [Candidatus Bathyarchaeota archaeon]|nr:flavodoxin domain-containing protein [Candidatus Bathyarchaeum tardum]WGM89297.1 MAG: flavodoxin domain-containing protein [Candidatus Bathyarchaeum tardum]WNZ28422.1 MAG: hypothetical protein IAX21_07065 [Candidatus Bathyarchaeota archaeon]